MASPRDNADAWASAHDGETVWVQWVYTGGSAGPPQAFVMEATVFSTQHRLVLEGGVVRPLMSLERMHPTAEAAWEAAAETLHATRNRWDAEIARCLEAAAASRITAGVPS